MAILHTATRPSDFTTWSDPASKALVTSNSSLIDTTYVSHGIEALDNNNSVSFSGIIETVAPATTYWVHLNYYKGVLSSGEEDGHLFDVFDASDNLIFRFDVLDASFIPTVYGDTTDTSITLTIPNISRTSRTTFDVSITVDASNITVEVYENGLSQGSATVANTVSGFGKPTKSEFTAFDMKIGTSGFYAVAISEIIIADESTIGMRLAELSLASAGNYSDHTGTLAGQFDNDDQTFLNSNTNGDRTSATLSAFGGDTVGYEILDVRMSSTAVITQGSPTVTTLKHFARISATDYDNATAHTVTTTPGKGYQSSWATNPNTASAWTFSDLSTLEVGIKAET